MASAEIETRNTGSISGLSQLTEALARPKPVPPGFLEDRRSVYWVDKKPQQPQGRSEDGGSQITTFSTTTRLDELAQHRALHSKFRHHRESSIWPVASATMSAEPSQRIIELGKHRPVHQNFKMMRSPFPNVSSKAINATASERVEGLAKPKSREDKHDMYTPTWGASSTVTEAAKKATPSERIDTLAQSKSFHEEFKEHKPTKWAVTAQALKAIASLRLQQLARPRSRAMIKDDYDPYKVSTAAKKSRPTPRLDELSAPVPRKIRQKKVTGAAPS